MSSFMIILVKMHDREKFISGYGQKAPKLVKKFGGEYVIVAPSATLLEGNLDGYTSVAISKWPNRQAATNFWNSDEYAEVKKLREGLSETEVLLVDAI